jgi:hypothetical protein
MTGDGRIHTRHGSVVAIHGSRIADHRSGAFFGRASSAAAFKVAAAARIHASAMATLIE